MCRLRNGCLAVLLLLVPLWAQAAQNAQAQPIIIRADLAILNRQAGIGVYKGHVELVQGQRRLEAQRLKLFLENGELRKAVAWGDPVRIREGDALRGHAQRIVYDVAQGTVSLYQQAFIFHQGRTFQGAELHYKLKTGRVRASGNEHQRVKVVIPASQVSTDNRPQDPH